MPWISENDCPEELLLKQSIQEGYGVSAELIAHIDSCETCQQRLENLTSGHSLSATRDQWQRHTSARELLSPPLRPTDLGSIGQFAVESVIGAGGMGIVYRGWDTLLGRAVAIKVVKPDQSDQANQRFRRECLALAQIQHDHIVPVYSTGPLPNGMSYLVLPLMTGGSLSELLADHLLPTRQAAEIVHAVACGLSAAHAVGLIHRDVKPANVLFDEPGGRPRLTDFGLVRMQQDQRLTQSDLICGTPEYMSPEQAFQPDRIDARSDVYSLGITLYQCLTGAPPYRGHPLDILNQHRIGDVMAPSRLNRQISRDLEAICLKAISTAPEDRYSSAMAFADDLRRFLDSRPVNAKPASNWKRTKLWCHRNRSLAVSLATIFLVLLSAVIVSWTFWFRSEVNAREAFKLNTQLIATNQELLANRNRLRTSVRRFQEKVFSDESLHWQMSRDFRANMFRDVIDFLDDFSSHDPFNLQSDQLDPLSKDYLEVARAAAHVRQNDEAQVAAGRVIARLQALVETKDNPNLANWSMLNEAARILIRIDADEPTRREDNRNDKKFNWARHSPPSWNELLRLSQTSATRALEIAPADVNAKLNYLATQYTCLFPPQAEGKSSDTNSEDPTNKRSVGKLEEILTKVIELADSLQPDEYAAMSAAVTLATEISWKIIDDNPQMVETWSPLIERQIVRCREVLRSHELSITGMELLRGGDLYHRGLALMTEKRHTEAAKLFGEAIPILNRAVVLQPQNRRAVLEYGQVTEAAARCFMQIDDYQQAQRMLDASLIVVSQSLQTDPADNDLRKKIIEWFCLYGDVSRQIEDYDWATRGYATAAGDCKLFANPSPELLRWSYEKRKYALNELLEIIDKSPMADKRAMYEQMVEQLDRDLSQLSSATSPKP